MSKLRIAIVGLSVEALIGSPLKTDSDAMQTYRAKELPENNLWLVRGILARIEEERDVEAVPLLWSTALPGGALTLANYEQIKAETCALLKENGPFDGVVIANHGALEVDDLHVQADGDYLAAVRATIGPDVPVSVALDLHGHITPEMLENATVFSALRTAPHRDDKQTGYRACHQLLRVIRTGIRPKTAAVHIPILIAGEQAITPQTPGAHLYASLPAYDSRDGIMEANIMVGFAFNDRPWTGMTAIATSDGDLEQAKAAALDLARDIWNRRDDFILRMETASIEDGLLMAAETTEKPVYVSDSGDNTTAGAPGDLTTVLQAALKDPRLGNAVFAGIYAPELVAQALAAGKGASIDFELGAEHISLPGGRMKVTGTIEGYGAELVLGGFQPYRSAEGGWAAIRIGDVIATFHNLPIGITTPAHFRAMGIDPVAHSYYVVKLGYLHPQIQDIAARHILLLTGGTVDLNLAARDWKHVPRPVYPVDPTMDWSPESGLYTN
ncbi:M81 family metallopeptidase [uncultured Martelella sp.]|uniref:M81 family metallopeptidase n=1 Tax=uncultured Martelella sp. TaxID=392331 RepID=UPI0029C61335|nr:M81 family metallopeptidase [uncultured Martelella sp.]